MLKQFTLIANAITAFLALNGADTPEKMKMCADEKIMCIDPFLPFSTAGKEELLDIYQRFGIRRFLYCAPSKNLRQIGYPDMKPYEDVAKVINEYNKFFADAKTPVKVSWWNVLSLKYGHDAPYQHITGIDGKVTKIGLCPLDENFIADSAKKMAHVAEKTRAELILIEDDYSLQNHTKDVKFGCFCPLHLQAFAKKAGRFYSREELYTIFTEDKTETLPLRKLWAECAKNSLVKFASAMREAVDKVSPETRIGVCETNNTDADGYVSIDVPRALAGKNTQPFIRVRGSWYTSYDSPQRTPDYMAHTLYTAERLPEDFEFVIENDTYPHTTYYSSPEQLRLMLDNALILGADNSLLYAAQYGADPTEDPAFLNMYKRNIKRFGALKSACRTGFMDGLHIVYDPMCESAKMMVPRAGRLTLVHSSAMLARMGIPHSTKHGSVKLLIGENAAVLSDEALKEILSCGVMIDASAADILCKRGFADLLGVDVKPMTDFSFVTEKICDLPIFSHIKNRHMSNTVNAAGLNTKVKYVNLIPRPGTQELTTFDDHFGKRVQSGMTLFTNRLGGRVCVLAGVLTDNLTSNLFNLRKQEIFYRVFKILGKGEFPAAVKRTPNMWLQMRRTEKDTLFFISNLSTSPREDVPVYLSKEFQGKAVKELQIDGSWKQVKVEKADDESFIFEGVYNPVQMRVFKIAK